MRVGVVGLGIMSAPMAMHLHKAGLLAVVYNRARAKAEPFAKLGVYVAESPADLAGRVDVVVVMVSDGPDVEQVLFGPGEWRRGARPGLVVVDMYQLAGLGEEVRREACAARRGVPRRPRDGRPEGRRGGDLDRDGRGQGGGVPEASPRL